MASLADYITEVLKNAVYEKGEELDVIVTEAPDLPGCFTQAATLEEARANLVDAIAVWLRSGLCNGEALPIVNGCRLAPLGRKPLDRHRIASAQEAFAQGKYEAVVDIINRLESGGDLIQE